jgi:hypothetical protein
MFLSRAVPPTRQKRARSFRIPADLDEKSVACFRSSTCFATARGGS